VQQIIFKNGNDLLAIWLSDYCSQTGVQVIPLAVWLSDDCSQTGIQVIPLDNCEFREKPAQ
jgi:hypothetical protein